MVKDLFKASGLALFGFMVPRILVGYGYPIDVYAQEIGVWLFRTKTMIDPNTALNIAGLLFAVILITVELWLKPIGKVIGFFKDEKDPSPEDNVETKESKPIPNMTAKEVFKHIFLESKYCLGLDPNAGNFYFAIDGQIVDKASTGQLNVWARKSRDYISGFKSALDLIKNEDWANYDMHFELPSLVQDDYLSARITSLDKKPKFNDVQLNKEQVYKLWPKAIEKELKDDPLNTKRIEFYRLEKNNQIKPTENKETKVELLKAMDYLIDILFPEKIENVNRIDVGYRKAVNLLTEKFRTGELKSWGRYAGESVEREFDKDEWKYRELLPLQAGIHASNRPQTKLVKDDTDDSIMTMIRVDFNQVKRIWPEKM